MSKVLVALALSVVTMAANAQSADAARVSTFTGSPALARLRCTSAYQQAQLDQQLGDMADAQARRNYGTTPDDQARSDAVVSAAKQFAACMTDAQGKGIEALKTFAAGLPDDKLKADGRKLLAAWLALPGTDDADSPQQAAYNAAAAALRMDAAGV